MGEKAERLGVKHLIVVDELAGIVLPASPAAYALKFWGREFDAGRYSEQVKWGVVLTPDDMAMLISRMTVIMSDAGHGRLISDRIVRLLMRPEEAN